MKPITVFLPAGAPDDLQKNLDEFNNSGLTEKCYVLSPPTARATGNTPVLAVSALTASETVLKIASQVQTPYLLIYNKEQQVHLSSAAIQRLVQVAESTGAGMVYSGYNVVSGSSVNPNPVIDYQPGSLRDDFNFGSLVLYNTLAFKDAASRMKEHYQHAGMYDLRLKLSQTHTIFHLPELLYNEAESDTRKSGEKQFDYVNPRNREVQIEMEKACTNFLKETNAWLEPRFNEPDFDCVPFKTELSVIIPVKNRANTISDAIRSVLSQKTSFSFNLIVINNHSTDGTKEAINQFGSDKRLLHLIPEQTNLGIGGCWNVAVTHEACGKFAVQLDSDDIYSDDRVLEKIHAAFYEQQCAMVVGSYKMVNFDLKEIPPGIIDHREWTPDNGRNNALRINGLGAPRAFYTPVLRSVLFPDVSYGEDYAVGLHISRLYRIGRIYEPLYLCRRWEGNSDAALDVNKLNSYNFYKDKIRTMEFLARQLFNLKI